MADVFNFYVKDDRSIQFNIAEPILLEDKDVTEFQFRIPKSLNGFDMSTWAWWFVYVNPKKKKYSIPLILVNDEDDPDNFSVATVSINYGITEKEGGIQFALEVIDADAGGTILHEWHTRTYHTAVIWTLQGNQVEYEEDITQDILSSILEQIAVNRTQIALNKARIDNIAHLPEGSTTADAELIDIRVGANGETYPTAGDAVRGQVGELKSALDESVADIKEDLGEWHYSKTVSSKYPYIQLNSFGSRIFFKLVEPTEHVNSFAVYGTNDHWQTQTPIYSQSLSASGSWFYVDIPSGYTSIRFALNMSQAYTGTYSAIIHSIDNHSISQYVLDLVNDVNSLDTSLAESVYSIGDVMTGTNYNGFYLNIAPYRGISSISNTIFNLRKYAVEANKKYYFVGKGISLMAELPLAAFGTEEVVAKNSYIEKILDGHTTGTDYFTSYIPDVDGYIYVAWVTNKAELQLYGSQLVSDAVDEILTDSANIKKDIKIQLFGDSITDNQWGDRTTWANYITDMMPNYNVTIVNDAVGGSGIGHGASKGTTDSHQDDEYNYVHDLVTDGQTLQTDANVIVVLAGTNNWTSGTPLGDISSTGAGTIYGALKGIVEYISQHSEAIIFICTIPQRYNSADQSKPTNDYGEPLNGNEISLAEYCVPYEKVSAFYGIPCVHLNTALGWNRINITDFCGDGLHPNAKGDVMLAKYICSEIMKHI